MIDRQAKDLMLAYALRNERVASQAFTRIRPDMWLPLEAEYSLVWSVFTAYYERTKSPITRALLEAEFERGDFADGVDDEQIDRANALVDRLFHQDLTLDPKLAGFIISDYLQEFLTDRGFMQAQAASEGMAFKDYVETLNETFRTTRVASEEAIDPFDPSSHDDEVYDEKPIATGFELFDAMTNGGVRKRRTVGVLGVTGGGKTLTGINLAVALAKIGRTTTIFTAETPAIPEFRNRLWSCALGLPTDVFDSPYRMLPGPIRKRVDEVSDQFRNRIHLVDFVSDTAGANGVPDIVSHLDEMKQRDINPDAVFIDWLGVFAGRYMSAQNIQESEQTSVFNRFLREINQNVAIGMDTCAVVAHQLNTEAGKKSIRTPTSGGYFARGTGSFADLTAFCFSFGQKDPKGICRVTRSKGRGGDVNELFVQIDGDKARMQMLDGQWTVSIGVSGAEEFVRFDDD